MNAVHGAPKTAPAEPVAPEKLVIKNRSGEEGSLMAKWLRGAQLAAQIVFFIGCVAVAIALERLMNLFKTAAGDGVSPASGQPEVRNAQGHPERIKVPMLPIDNYNQLDSNQLIHRLAGLSDEQLRIVKAHETGHKSREDVLEAIDQRLGMDR